MKEELPQNDVSRWYRVCKTNLPSGTMATIQTTTDKGQPESVSLIHRELENENDYIVPVTRDLLPSEIQNVVDDAVKTLNDYDFDISTNSRALKVASTPTIKVEHEKFFELCLAVAKQKHEAWVRERSNAGWRYGTTFNIASKTHPLLLPWDQLPDHYRKPDMETPQLVVSLLDNQGYAIVSKEELGKMNSQR